MFDATCHAIGRVACNISTRKKKKCISKKKIYKSLEKNIALFALKIDCFKCLFTLFMLNTENCFRNVQNLSKNIYDISISPTYLRIEELYPRPLDIHRESSVCSQVRLIGNRSTHTRRSVNGQRLGVNLRYSARRRSSAMSYHHEAMIICKFPCADFSPQDSLP